MTWYVVDGMDGSGKSTVAEMIRSRLESEGRSVAVFTHPSRDTVIGRLSLRYLTKEGKAALLCSTAFYIMDILRSLFIMRRGRRRYDDVIFVRYIMAVSYIPERLCRPAYTLISHILPMPDVAVLVDVDPSTALDRICCRGEELEVFETVERLETVRRRMLSLSDGWFVLDNCGGTRDLEAQVLRILSGDYS